MKPFTGLWATFTSPDDIRGVLLALKKNNLQQITVHSPYIIDNLDLPGERTRNGIACFSFFGAALGAFLSVYLIIQMNLEWIQPLSAKPILSPLTIVPVAFELTVLAMVVFTLIGVGVMTTHACFTQPVPDSTRYREYNRFTRDRFGVIVTCDPALIATLQAIFSQHHAEEIIIET